MTELEDAKRETLLVRKQFALKLADALDEVRYWRSERNAIARLRADTLDERDTVAEENVRLREQLAELTVELDQHAADIGHLRNLLGLPELDELVVT